MAAHKYGMEGSDVQMIQRRGEARDGWNENKCGWMVMLVGGGPPQVCSNSQSLD